MGIIKGIGHSISGSLADQWKDIITAGKFNEQLAVAPGIRQNTNRGRGVNTKGSVGVISNGSIVRIPENTAAFIFSQSGIEQIVNTPGEFIYNNGELSYFNGERLHIIKQSFNRLGFGGQASVEKHISFVNLREIRGLKFKTAEPLIYNDQYYDSDLEINSRGEFSIKITNPKKFVTHYLPANVEFYSFEDENSKSQISSEFIQSFAQALNSLSTHYRISSLPSASKDIVKAIAADVNNVGSWEERFGFKLVNVGIELIQLSDTSRELINHYSSSKLDVKAYEKTPSSVSDIAAQQKIATGIKNKGFGDGAGMILGMNLATDTNPVTATTLTKSPLSINEQIEVIKQLKELFDVGILSKEEFDKKKKEIMDL